MQLRHVCTTLRQALGQRGGVVPGTLHVWGPRSGEAGLLRVVVWREAAAYQPHGAQERAQTAAAAAGHDWVSQRVHERRVLPHRCVAAQREAGDLWGVMHDEDLRRERLFRLENATACVRQPALKRRMTPGAHIGFQMAQKNTSKVYCCASCSTPRAS